MRHLPRRRLQALPHPYVCGNLRSNPILFFPLSASHTMGAAVDVEEAELALQGAAPAAPTPPTWPPAARQPVSSAGSQSHPASNPSRPLWIFATLTPLQSRSAPEPRVCCSGRAAVCPAGNTAARPAVPRALAGALPPLLSRLHTLLALQRRPCSRPLRQQDAYPSLKTPL